MCGRESGTTWTPGRRNVRVQRRRREVGVGRFLVAPRYTAYVKFADLAAYRKFVARRPSWADVVALVRASSAGSGA